MAKMTVILHSLTSSNEGDEYVLKFTASPRALILNKFRIYIRWDIQERKPCWLPG